MLRSDKKLGKVPFGRTWKYLDGNQLSTIRPFRSEDFEANLDTLQEGYKQETLESLSADLISELLASKNFPYSHILEIDGEFAGFIFFRFYVNEFSNMIEIIMRSVYVLPEWRSLTSISRLLKSVEEIGRESGATVFKAGIDSAIQADRKGRVFRYLGFRLSTPYLVKKVNLACSELGAEKHGRLFPGIAAYRVLKTAWKDNQLTLLYYSATEAVRYCLGRKAGVPICYFTSGNPTPGFAIAMVERRFEDRKPYVRVFLCESITGVLPELQKWALSFHCEKIVIDTSDYDLDARDLVDDFDQNGFDLIGGCYHKLLVNEDDSNCGGFANKSKSEG